MFRQTMIALTSAIAVGVGVAGSAEAASLIGISFAGDAFSINSETGAGTLLGASGFFGTNSAASDSSGNVYTADSRNLIQINPLTGAGTSVANFSGELSVRGLAFDENDILYAVLDGEASASVSEVDSLATIDINTGFVSQIAPISNLRTVQSLAFSPDGRLFAEDLSNLYELNPLTGAASLIGPSSESIQALEFTSTGELLGIRNQLFNIDPSTGATNLIGDGDYDDIRGLAFISSTSEPVPEPASLLGLAAIGAVAAGGALKKKAVA